ncbi:hypothetical protein CA982_03240 [Gordonia lacunae]|uniref:Uncharacterized protein n=1 Tax=Gordonia lacunae TaxID=417102 RepID=A0A243QHH4_9ACTN|nr:hypothetical protein CA982_03240 [Gordonia lacunae]
MFGFSRLDWCFDGEQPDFPRPDFSQYGRCHITRRGHHSCPDLLENGDGEAVRFCPRRTRRYSGSP